jgi:hypothetical protein
MPLGVMVLVAVVVAVMVMPLGVMVVMPLCVMVVMHLGVMLMVAVVVMPSVFHKSSHLLNEAIHLSLHLFLLLAQRLQFFGLRLDHFRQRYRRMIMQVLVLTLHYERPANGTGFMLDEPFEKACCVEHMAARQKA